MVVWQEEAIRTAHWNGPFHMQVRRMLRDWDFLSLSINPQVESCRQSLNLKEEQL